MTTGQYGGIGAIISKRGDYIIISEPYEGFPANKAGLIPGDKILKVNKKSVKGKSTEDVSKVLKGQPNTSVKLLVERLGEDKPLEFDLIREEVKIKSVPFFAEIEDNIGYIKLNAFHRNVSNEVAEAFNEINKDKSLKGLIFDLRGNPGGLLNEAVDITNLFIDKGLLVVSTKGKIADWDKLYKTTKEPLDTKIPLVILVDSRSASASEIVSGAVQDLDRGVLIGQRTFGKGLVQQTRKLTYNSQLKVTIAKYYIPSGRCINSVDYSNRNEDGSVGQIADSLKKEFKTSNGRIVLDGGGVNPDIVLERKKYSNILASIMSKRLIFDFANEFYYKNSSIKNFNINDSLYNEFVEFLKNKEYQYETKTEKALNKMIKDAEKEKYFSDLKTGINILKAKMDSSKNNDIIKFKKEISQILEGEIISRYTLQRGRLENSLKYDQDVKEAISLIQDSEKYNNILNTNM